MTARARRRWMSCLAIAVIASTARADLPPPPPRTNELVRVFRSEVIPPPLGPPGMPDYVGIVLERLSRCARTAPRSTLPFAGRARLLLDVSARDGQILVIDVEPGLRDLEPRCIAPERSLPPLPSPSYFRFLINGRMQAMLDLDIDARGLPSTTPLPTDRPLGRSVELTLDSRELGIEVRAADETYDPRGSRDDVLIAFGSLLPDLARCLDVDIERGTYRGEDVALTVSVDARGIVREVHANLGLVASGCIERILRGRTLPAWRAGVDATLRLLFHAH